MPDPLPRPGGDRAAFDADAFYHVLDGRAQSLHALAKCGADLVFNLTESYGGDDAMDMNIAAYLELLGFPYTGGGPHAQLLAQDKALAKKMFAFHGIRTPYFATAYRGNIDHAHDIEFPLIVKPLKEDGSIGIDAESVVKSIKELMERVEYIQNEFDSPALIEEYIEGREIYAPGGTGPLASAKRHAQNRKLRCEIREGHRGLPLNQIASRRRSR